MSKQATIATMAGTKLSTLASDVPDTIRMAIVNTIATPLTTSGPRLRERYVTASLIPRSPTSGASVSPYVSITKFVNELNLLRGGMAKQNFAQIGPGPRTWTTASDGPVVLAPDQSVDPATSAEWIGGRE